MTGVLVCGIGAILLGLPYILHAFGPTEAEVVTWGRACLGSGVALVLLAAVIGWSRKRIARLVAALGCAGLALLQVLPIYLWFVFHGTGISDGTPPSAFVAHWGYAIPHLALLLACLVVLSRLVRR